MNEFTMRAPMRDKSSPRPTCAACSRAARFANRIASAGECRTHIRCAASRRFTARFATRWHTAAKFSKPKRTRRWITRWSSSTATWGDGRPRPSGGAKLRNAHAEVLSGGNFHGEPVAFALDFLAIALSALAGISERRIERLVNPALNEGLPPFLAPGAGLNSGFMMPQVTAAALVSENKVLAHPASVDSITTSGNKEDYVSMGMTAALKLRRSCREHAQCSGD